MPVRNCLLLLQQRVISDRLTVIIIFIPVYKVKMCILFKLLFGLNDAAEGPTFPGIKPIKGKALFARVLHS